MNELQTRWDQICRATLGAYLFVHFATLLRWAPELFSSAGVLPKASDSPLIHLFPTILAVFDSPRFVTLLIFAAAGLSVLFAAGIADRTSAIALWYISACLLGRNPLIANPAMPYVGWLLLAHGVIPKVTAPTEVSPNSSEEPRTIRRHYATVAWILMACGYTYSGLMKLSSPSWIDGSALERILSGPLARPNIFRSSLLGWPPILLHALTWATLTLEILFGPACVFPKMRRYAWSAMLAIHLALFAAIDFADLTAGMVILHLFTFNLEWVKPRVMKIYKLRFSTS